MSNNYCHYLHITVELLGARLPWKQKGWLSKHTVGGTVYTQSRKQWEGEWSCWSILAFFRQYPATNNYIYRKRKEQTGCKHFLLQDSFIPLIIHPAPADENKRYECKPMWRNTAEHRNEQITEKACLLTGEGAHGMDTTKEQQALLCGCTIGVVWLNGFQWGKLQVVIINYFSSCWKPLLLVRPLGSKWTMRQDGCEFLPVDPTSLIRMAFLFS